MACNVELSKSLVMVEVSIIKILRTGEVCFSCVGIETKCRVNRRLRQAQPGRRVVVPEEIELVVRRGELAVRLQKRRIMSFTSRSYSSAQT